MKEASLSELRAAVNARMKFIRVDGVEDLEKTIISIRELFSKYKVSCFFNKEELILKLKEQGTDSIEAMTAKHLAEMPLYLAIDLWRHIEQIQQIGVRDPLLSIVFVEPSRLCRIKRLMQCITREVDDRFPAAREDLKSLDYAIFDDCDVNIIEDLVAYSLVRYKRVTAESIEKSREFFVDGNFAFRLAGEKT